MSASLLTAELSCARDGRALFAPVQIKLETGELIELQGPNGVGKSTLLRALAGLDTQFVGNVHRPVPLLYQGHRNALNANLSALQNLRWLMHLGPGRPVTDQDMETGFSQVGLAGYEDTPCQQMSEGQQRRVLLARLALSLMPSAAPLWLLDEPLTALDEAAIELLRSLLQRHLAAGGAVIAATHVSLRLPATPLRLIAT